MTTDIYIMYDDIWYEWCSDKRSVNGNHQTTACHHMQINKRARV